MVGFFIPSCPFLRRIAFFSCNKSEEHNKHGPIKENAKRTFTISKTTSSKKMFKNAKMWMSEDSRRRDGTNEFLTCCGSLFLRLWFVLVALRDPHDRWTSAAYSRCWCLCAACLTFRCVVYFRWFWNQLKTCKCVGVKPGVNEWSFSTWPKTSRGVFGLFDRGRDHLDKKSYFGQFFTKSYISGMRFE